ncbi:hypothetical protein Ahy_A10g049727 isoform A [Arachis hypogaea]|uniref:Uncharacterized protein n=1 Tax=Arachis hypogaea TaxID=3818 RepID=A0A445B7T7_ARAHY|nr:hypothetical protein Ahy_A10g049727 isoform A [Arachis hypogaea]
MNRSFRAQESQMQGALKQRQQQFGGLRGSSAAKEKDEELALFLEMKKREKERNDLLLHTSEEFDSALVKNAIRNPLAHILTIDKLDFKLKKVI